MDTDTKLHLAELNIGRTVAPIDSPLMAGFVSALDEINALAESSPGFVWRLKTDDNNATSLHPYRDPLVIVNLSVWETVEDLKVYAYQSRHVHFVRRRHEWFESFEKPYMVMWWIPAGSVPTIEEAKARLEHITHHGPTAHAFNFHKMFAPQFIAVEK
jgi:Domain of unknown function (DUF3291)